MIKLANKFTCIGLESLQNFEIIFVKFITALLIPSTELLWELFLISHFQGVFLYRHYTFFCEKLGPEHSTKSFLLQHEILSISVLKFCSLISYFLNA